MHRTYYLVERPRQVQRLGLKGNKQTNRSVERFIIITVCVYVEWVGYSCISIFIYTKAIFRKQVCKEEVE